MDTILVFLLVCGRPDTVIIKHPDKAPIYSHSVNTPKVSDSIIKILKNKPTIIIYEDKRGVCA